jgi:hypothetical protein
MFLAQVAEAGAEAPLFGAAMSTAAELHALFH